MKTYQQPSNSQNSCHKVTFEQIVYYSLSRLRTSSNSTRTLIHTMYECATCTRTFASSQASRQHMNAADHYLECGTCDRQFYSQQSCNQHKEAMNHWPYDCDRCDLTFPTRDDVEQHMNIKGHWRYYCKECKRVFQNENNLRMILFFALSPTFAQICVS